MAGLVAAAPSCGIVAPIKQNGRVEPGHEDFAEIERV
jgi:hypothetical protein